MLALGVQAKELVELNGRRGRNKAFCCANGGSDLLKAFTLAEKLQGITRDVAVDDHIQIHTKTKRFGFKILDVGGAIAASHQALQLGERLVSFCISIHCIPHIVANVETANAWALDLLLFATFIVPIIGDLRNKSTLKGLLFVTC